jgi:hypothetical protein
MFSPKSMSNLGRLTVHCELPSQTGLLDMKNFLMGEKNV